MAVRTVSVLLTADIAAFRARMGEASRTSSLTAAQIRTSMTNAGRTMNQVGQNQQKTLKAVQMGSLALVAAFGLAVAAAAKFEKAMSNVQAVTRASAGDMTTLRNAALVAGRTTAFSAVQAADAMHELAKAGVSTADIAGGALTGALNLAAAAEVNVAEGAEIAANAMTVFGLSGKDVGHVADLLAAAANKSTTDVHQMGMSLRMAGQVASQTGLSIEDTVGALTLFASEGLKGSDAGTSFKVMLQRLTPQSKEAQATMDRLGLSAYDAQGQFVGLQNFAGRMQDAFKDLTPEARNAAMGIIFGSDAVRAANILYKYGEAGLKSYTDAVDDSGYAAAVAQTRMNNLVGDLKLLKSALETALIQTGTAANAALRDMVQWITRLVNAYNGLPPGLQEAVGILTGFAGVIGLVGASLMLFLPRIALVRRELIALGVTANTTKAAMMGLGRLGLVAAVIGAMAYGADQLTNSLKDAPPKVTELTQALLTFARTGKVAGELSKTFGKDLAGLGDAAARIAHPGALDRIGDALYEITHLGIGDDANLEAAREKIAALDASLASLVQNGAANEAAINFNRYAAEAEAAGTSTEKFRTLLPGYAEALAQSGLQTDIATGSQGQLGDATAMTADEMADQRSEAEKLTDALKALNGIAISVAEGEIQFQDSLDQLSETVKENGKSLDVTSEKGRAVKGAFLDAAKAAMEHAQAVADQMGSQEAGNAVLAKNIGLLRETMAAAGFTAPQIDALTAAYAKLPTNASTQVSAPGAAEAMRQIDNVYASVAKLQPGKTITIKAPTGEAVQALQAAGYAVKSIPNSRDVRVTAPTNAAQSSVSALKRALDALRDRLVTVTTVHRTVQNNTVGRPQKGEGNLSKHAGGGLIHRYAAGGSVWGFPAGGMVFGPGSSTSDDVPAWLSNGEYVIRASAVSKYGVGLLDALNQQRFASGGPVGYAKGGKVSAAVTNARRELPGDFAEFSRSLAKSASDIRSASNAMITDLKKLGNAGWRLAGQVDATSRRLQGMANERDRIRTRIAEAREYATQRQGDASEFMKLTSGGEVRDIIDMAKQRQNSAGAFQQMIRSLERRGLHRDLLRQVIEEGPGSVLARKLSKASSSEIGELNRLAKNGAKLAGDIGRTTADAMYDAGRNASRGFLTGLQSQEKALQAQMDKLGKSMVTAIKKALKIKSPSQVMRDEIGRQVGAGLVVGMDRSLVDVHAAAGRMSAASVHSKWPTPQVQTAASPSGGEFVGDLYLDSGQFLGAVRGTVRPMIRESEKAQAYRARVGRG